MYDELVKRLREHDGWALNETLDQAADAIENTSSAYQMMAEAYEAEVTKQRWIPVTERLPDNEVSVLVVRKFLGIKGCPAKLYVEVAEYCYGDWIADSDEYKIARSKHTDPLYWMPLPQPPKEE